MLQDTFKRQLEEALWNGDEDIPNTEVHRRIHEAAFKVT